jgi:hypothetical protein
MTNLIFTLLVPENSPQGTERGLLVQRNRKSRMPEPFRV